MIHVCNETTQTKITELVEKDIQPNAVDIRIKRVFKANTDKLQEVILNGDTKIHADMVEVFPDADGFFTLTSGYYQIEMLNRVQMGEAETGLVVPRSTLMRNGILVHTCLYDSGYCGKMVAGMTIADNIQFRLPVGERIAQFLCFKAESLHQYNGSYQEQKL